MRYFLWLLLYVYGLLFHMTASEFWPITISKTWFTPDVFEYSMLQKPLLSLFLAAFHLLPLSDVIHVFLVKTVFAVIGIAALTYFAHFILEITAYRHEKIQKSDLAALMAFFLVCVSPAIRFNYFSVRSDQVAFLFFALFLLYCGRRQFWQALSTLVLIPCFGIKEIVFLVPGILYFIWTFKSAISTKLMAAAVLFSLSVLVWVVALNMNSIFYLLQTFDSANYALRFGPLGLLAEAHLCFFSIAGIIYVFATRAKEFYITACVSICGIALVLVLPQATPFFLASMLPLFFLPLFVLLLSIKLKFFKESVAVILLCWSLAFSLYYRIPWHQSNVSQLWFIEIASKVIAGNKLSYLDGQGILPRQKFLPCFVSPDDDNANNGCKERLTQAQPDAIIITNRLASLGEMVFRASEARYQQLYPNLWIKNEKMNDTLKAKTDLSGKTPIPIIIF